MKLAIHYSYLLLRTMNILILGKEETATIFAKKMIQSHHCNQLFILPGNNETQQLGSNLVIENNNENDLQNICFEHQIDLIVNTSEDISLKGLDGGKYIIIEKNSALEELFSTPEFLLKFTNENEIPYQNQKTNTLQIVILTNSKEFQIISMVDDNILSKIEECVIQNVLNGLRNLQSTGNYFLCLELSKENGNYYLSEFDFSLDAVLFKTCFEHLETDLVSLFAAMDNGTYEDVNIEFYEIEN